jgi:hypothetical protein
MKVESQFRKVSWGMSKADVRAREQGIPVNEDNDALYYEGSLVGSPCLVAYHFERGHLVSGSYVIDNADDVSDVTDFEQLKEMLTKKYGSPNYDQADWKEPYRSIGVRTYGDYAKAVARGDVILRAGWETRDTRIWLVCTEDKALYNAIVYVFYTSLNHIQQSQSRLVQEDMEMI